MKSPDNILDLICPNCGFEERRYYKYIMAGPQQMSMFTEREIRIYEIIKRRDDVFWERLRTPTQQTSGCMLLILTIPTVILIKHFAF